MKQSEKCIKQVERYANTHNNKHLKIEVINGRGNNCFQSGQNEKALQYYREAEDKVKSVDDSYLEAKIQNNIANILVNTGKTSEGIAWCTEML